MDSEPDRDTVASGENREHGIEFGELTAKLAAHDYPTTRDDLLAAYGDSELGLPGGSTTLAEILVTSRDESGGLREGIRYESPDDVHESIYNLVGSEAVGRVGYSDRAGSSPGNERDLESL